MNDVPIPSNSPVLQGLGISSGIVRGRAVVLKDIDKMKRFVEVIFWLFQL